MFSLELLMNPDYDQLVEPFLALSEYMFLQSS